MKTTFAVCGAAALLFAATISRADILAGPITNSVNGHDYYLLAPAPWSVSEAEAENLGGTLAVVRDADEQKWVYSTFGVCNGTNHSLWIGLHRMWPGGPFAWMDGTKPGYFHWDHDQPDNANNNESCVEIYAPGSGRRAGHWNDAPDNRVEDESPVCGVAEVVGNSNEKSLSSQEKSLVGLWYENGDASRPCYVTATENMLFAINQGRAGRLLSNGNDNLFITTWNAHGEIVKDRILWSTGSWWSRKPSEYGGHNDLPLIERGYAPMPMMVGPRPVMAGSSGL